VRTICLTLCFLALLCFPTFAADFRVGVASVDITPDYPIRLSGYVARQKESEGVQLPIKAKAIALNDGVKTALVLSVDNCAIPRHLWETIVQRLRTEHGLGADQIVIFSSHTHSAPALSGAIPNMFAKDLPPEEQAKIDRYTRELTGKLLSVSTAAIQQLQPARLYFGKGRVTFAKNRRTEGGPVDHDLPLLVARNMDGTPRMVLANYACHCTTLQGDRNLIHGDWSGVAQAALEQAIPGLTALISIGCGADSNPSPRGKPEHVEAHGQELAREVQSMLNAALEEITSTLEVRARDFDLPFASLPARAEWEKRAAEPAIVGYHARKNLARLDRGESLPDTLPYRVQTWNFGNQLAMIFLPGEVVIDYVRRLKAEFDPERLWVSGYANWVPCYIPSERILREGGYEAESSLWYYDQPARLSTNTEHLIIAAAQQQIPAAFKAEKKYGDFPPPKTPQRSLAAIRTEPRMKVQLVAAEPLIASPVALDWSADGKLWVVEMRDFPSGLDGDYKPGGRVSVLEDKNADGNMDTSTVFLEDLPFPTGITCWNGGALICAAPDILFARDTNGDGKADEVKKLFSGFATDNYQARVNSLSLGLDGWFYGANGLIGGQITGGALKSPLNISNRDFRFRPDTGEFEPASGLTQQGRVRDDFGNWFGCDNSTLLWHYPIHDHYLRRNPNFAPPATRVSIASGNDPNRLYPVSETQERFNDPQHANRATAACGLGIYRDELLGTEFYGNAFVCEPVHNLVRRMVLEENGATYKAIKPASEQREFFASQDSWFRPVQVRTGPDGALWVVDMYRMVVEHPRWITPERLKTLDLRAGANLGRIYRVAPVDHEPRVIENLEKLDSPSLAQRLNSSSGTERDRVQLEILKRKDRSVLPLVEGLLKPGISPQVQIQALSTLHSLNGLTEPKLVAALRSPDPSVRAFALSLCDGLPGSPVLEQRLAALAEDGSARVRFQLACTLGNFRGKEISSALARLIERAPDSWMRSALLSSVHGRALEVAEALREPEPQIFRALLESALAERAPRERIVQLIARAGNDLQVWQLDSLAALLRTSPDTPGLKDLIAATQELAAHSPALDRRVAALRVLAHAPGPEPESILRSVLIEGGPAEVVNAAAQALVTRGQLEPLYESWARISPGARRAVTSAVLRRPELVVPHLLKLEAFRSLGEISLNERQQLLKSSNPKIRAEVQRLFGARTSNRAEALRRFDALDPKSADATRGAELFGTHCASCHDFRGQGFAVGPNLAALTDRSTLFLLRAILDPNDAVENRYAAYTVETKDGESLSGIISDENASSLTVLNANGLKQVILRKDIAAIQSSQLSLMPEGLDQALSIPDMADLIAYLQTTEPAGAKPSR
jgi:putative membrane-bound dehydrogenase-like protein